MRATEEVVRKVFEMKFNSECFLLIFNFQRKSRREKVNPICRTEISYFQNSNKIIRLSEWDL